MDPKYLALPIVIYFAVIGVNYGAGNGDDTFNLPAFRVRFSLGSNGRYTGITIQSNGDQTHTVQGTTGSHGGSQLTDAMPPYQTIDYIIRT